MAVLGDSDFAKNRYYGLSGNGNFFLNVANWLTEEADLIAIQPKTQTPRTIQMTPSQGRLLMLVSLVLLPLAVLVAGRDGLAPEEVAVKLKTTLVLVAVFAALLALVLWFDAKGEKTKAAEEKTNTLIDLAAADVRKVAPHPQASRRSDPRTGRAPGRGA
ncbi:MAG: hypothetical protein M0C28_38430 [Candidatus Moduliflexus flocculans]|nr:hypothetical protein [Candidatus Moduliflexus flocculans]